MKVAILSNLFGPNSRGGAEEAAKNQAADFLNKGNEVIVITLSPTDTFSIQDIAGIRVYFLPHKNIFNYMDIGREKLARRFIWHIIDTFNLPLARLIKDILKAEKPDLVVSHNLKGLSFLTPRAVHQLGIPQSLVIHDVSLYTPSGLIIYGDEKKFEHEGVFTKIYRFFTKKLFSYPQKVIFPSAWLLAFYRKNGFFANQEKIYQPNLLPIEKEETAPTERKGFLYVGQLEEHKGINLLLDAFERLSSSVILSASEGSQDSSSPSAPQNDKFILNIVGDGRLMPEIKKRAEKNPNIIVHGRVPREELGKFYRAAKATVFPSIVYENAPMVIMESLSYGTPVIASRLGGAPERIKEVENGYTFNPGDANDLCEKMKYYA